MTAIHFPPIVRAWSQNFQWSMGVIKIHIFQLFASWFLRSTGGYPTNLLTSGAKNSVKIQKRTNSGTFNAMNVQDINLSGIGRVSYLASIEITNFFLTSYMWFFIAAFISILSIFILKFCLNALERRGKHTFIRDEEIEWSVYHKGILF